jgi:soluble lytic murein transglycosylase-like protein
MPNRPIMAALILTVGCTIPVTAAAQVLEIQPDGDVIRYEGPTQFLATGARRIDVSPAAPLRRRSVGLAAPSTETAEAIRDAAARHQVSQRLVEAVAWRESGFNPAAVSPKGARGVMQLMPSTARALGVDPADPAANIDGGVDYLSRLLRRFGGDQTKALAAYNAGPEAVDRFGGVPPYAETIAYVGAVTRRLARAVTKPSPPSWPRDFRGP